MKGASASGLAYIWTSKKWLNILLLQVCNEQSLYVAWCCCIVVHVGIIGLFVSSEPGANKHKLVSHSSLKYNTAQSIPSDLGNRLIQSEEKLGSIKKGSMNRVKY